MCRTCGNTFGHWIGCPDAPEPKPRVKAICECCFNSIYEGEGIYQVSTTNDSLAVCEDCLNSVTEQAVEEDGEAWSEEIKETI